MSLSDALKAAIGFIIAATQHYPQAVTPGTGAALFETSANLTSNANAVVAVPGQAVDASYPQTVENWACNKNQGSNRAIIQCYEAQCTTTGGGVRDSCMGNYQNAIAAGYQYVDLYFQPCTGSAYNCKPPSAQINEMVSYVKTNNMNIHQLWLDLEQDAICTSSWNGGPDANVALAQEFAGAAKDSGMNWGIYSTAGIWTTLFGATTAVVDPTLDLWYANYDNTPTMNDYATAPFGGWTTAVGKQYAENVVACGSFDLNVFSQ